MSMLEPCFLALSREPCSQNAVIRPNIPVKILARDQVVRIGCGGCL